MKWLTVLIAIPALACTLVLQPGPEGKDTFVSSSAPDTSYGDYDTLMIEGYPYYTYTYIDWEFDVDGEITYAEIGLMFFMGSDDFGFVEVANIAEEWVEDTTWNTKPQHSTTRYPDWIEEGEWRVADVTGETIDIDEGESYGMAFIFTGDTYYYVLYSSDYYVATHRPYLVIEYTATAIEPISLGAVKAVYR
jgi:hypothetical protein